MSRRTRETFYREWLREYHGGKKRERVAAGEKTLARTVRHRISAALKRNGKSEKSITLLGCSIPFLREYLESLFLPGMSWENYGYRGWHIDHIQPCASFDLSDIGERLRCFHYSNLRPLWARDNWARPKQIRRKAI